MFRLTIGSAISLALGTILGFAGLGMLLGTLDEYKAGRAFDRAMANYAARDLENCHEALNEASDAKDDYTAPLEAKGKLLIDEGASEPARYAEAAELFQRLLEDQETTPRVVEGTTLSGPSLPVLVGLAVAEIEAARSASPSRHASAAAIAQARRQLERARKIYPDAGDLYVNLATVALLRDDVNECKRLLDKVREVGSISVDALPYLYNLSGLVELREGRLPLAVEEFDKVKEFRPDWSVPELNRAAALAQSLVGGDLPPEAAENYARRMSSIVHQYAKAKSDLVSPICHCLAIHYLRANLPRQALKRFEQAEKHGVLGWQARFNRAIAKYLVAQPAGTSRTTRAPLYSDARRELEKAVRSRRAKTRDKFVAACILGTVCAWQEKNADAIGYFEQAEEYAAQSRSAAIRAALARVHRSLAALWYRSGQPQKAAQYIHKSKAAEDAKGHAAALLRQLGTAPRILKFHASAEKILTDFDLRISANVAALSSAPALTPKNIRLTLENALAGGSRSVPFRLHGPNLHAIVLNLPQGKFRARIEVTDAFGNRSAAQGDEFVFDREPPRIVGQKPGPGGSTTALSSIEFRVFDAISRVDFSSLSVTLQYAGGNIRALVSRGQCLFASKDGSIKRLDRVTENVRCPLPKEIRVGGGYAVTVRVRDNLGKQGETTWSFAIR